MQSELLATIIHLKPILIGDQIMEGDAVGFLSPDTTIATVEYMRGLECRADLLKLRSSAMR